MQFVPNQTKWSLWNMINLDFQYIHRKLCQNQSKVSKPSRINNAFWSQLSENISKFICIYILFDTIKHVYPRSLSVSAKSPRIQKTLTTKTNYMIIMRHHDKYGFTIYSQEALIYHTFFSKTNWGIITVKEFYTFQDYMKTSQTKRPSLKFHEFHKYSSKQVLYSIYLK